MGHRHLHGLSPRSKETICNERAKMDGEIHFSRDSRWSARDGWRDAKTLPKFEKHETRQRMVSILSANDTSRS